MAATIVSSTHITTTPTDTTTTSTHITTTPTDITTTPTSCTYCHHTYTRLQRNLHDMQQQLHYKPYLAKKIHHTKHKLHYIHHVMHTHTTRDLDNVLTCPLLKSYKCFKCHAFGHTPSRCTPCEYCEERGHNDRECPKKRADEKHTTHTVVLQLTKGPDLHDTLQALKLFASQRDIHILKEI